MMILQKPTPMNSLAVLIAASVFSVTMAEANPATTGQLRLPSRRQIAALSSQRPSLLQRAPYTSNSSQSTSTVTVTIDCPGTITVTATTNPGHYTTTAAASQCTGTSASCPCAAGYACNEISSCTWACELQTSMATATRQPTATTTATPVAAGGPPPYATGDVESYLPCVPGTFLCASETTFYTCDYNDGSVADEPDTAWVYDYPRTVAAGMMCLPQLASYSGSTSEYAQQGLTPEGFYRDDQYVAAGSSGS